MARIISAFPGTGKSHFFRQHEATGLVLDSDSSGFSWVEKDGEKTRNPNFPANYMNHIAENVGGLGMGGVILVSSHAEVRDALVDHGHDFTLVYPRRALKDEYMQRFRDRGNPEAFVNLIGGKWDEFLDQLVAQESATHVELGAGQYISDIVEPPRPH
jgi:hypothetical protein